MAGSRHRHRSLPAHKLGEVAIAEAMRRAEVEPARSTKSSWARS
jgi:hypothetical protein